VRNALLVLLILAAACGSTKPDPVVLPPKEGPPGDDPTEQPPAAADPDAALVSEARQFVAAMDAEMRKLYVDASVAAWANATDITPAHEAAEAKAGAEQAKGITRLIKAAKKFEPILGKLEPDLRRQLTLLKFAGQPAPDDPKQADELARIATEMQSIYGKGHVCRTPC
jgi:peptidyl-dipeptidase A